MQKLKITIFLCLFIAANACCQTIFHVKNEDAKYRKLKNDKNIFYVKKDSIQQYSGHIQSSQAFLLIGKCGTWEESCGIINLSMVAYKIAKNRGYNAASVNYYRETSKNDTLSVIFYRLSAEKIVALEQDKKKYITLISPKNSSDRDAKIDEEATTLYAGTYLRKEVKADKMKLRFGKGTLASTIKMDFKKVDKLYFIVDRHHLTGANGVGVGFSGTTLMVVSPLSGEIMLDFLSKSGDSDE
jgi:hypothetical protein